MVVKKALLLLAALAVIGVAWSQIRGQTDTNPGVNNASPTIWQLNSGLTLASPFGYNGYPPPSWTNGTLPFNVVPRESETLNAEVTKDGQLQVSWTGPTEFVSGAFIAILDKNKNELARERYDRPPVSYVKNPPKGAAYYRVVVTYVNAAVSSFTGPVPPLPEKAATTTPEKGTATKKPAPKKTRDSSGLTGP